MATRLIKSVSLKKIAQLILMISILLHFSYCKKDCFTSSGVRIIENRDLDEFNKINVYGYFDVYLESGNTNNIKIEAGENLIPNIETNVVDETLIIKDNNTCRFIKGYDKRKLYIRFKSIDELTVYDGADIYSTDTLFFDIFKMKIESFAGYCNLIVNSNTFSLEVWLATGDFIVKGKANRINLHAEKYSFIYTDELYADSCFITNNSIGDCYVKALDLLSVKIENEGNIYYSGSPSEIIIKEHSGTGNLIKQD